MFFLFLSLKLLGVCCLGIIVSFLILQVAFSLSYTIILAKKLSENDNLSKPLTNISAESCNNSRQTKKESNITNYSYAIKYCIRRRFYFMDVLRIFLTGRYHPSEVKNLKDHRNYRYDKNCTYSAIRIVYSPIPKVFFKPMKQVIQCFHLRRLYHRFKRVSTRTEENLKN